MLFQNAHDVFFAHDEEFLTVDLDGLTGILAEDDAVTNLDVRSDDAAGFVALAWADGHDFALVRLLACGVRKYDAEGSRRFSFKALDDDAIV